MSSIWWRVIPRPAGATTTRSPATSRRDRALRFNVRIATPPPGQDCAPGVGSSYVFSLKPGDIVSAIGPFGDFHIKPTQREMVYIGGGAGMAPLRAHLSHLLETEQSARKVSFWYGARSKQEIFYETTSTIWPSVHRNFAFHLALSSPLPEDNWTGHLGFIHQVVLEKYLSRAPQPRGRRILSLRSAHDDQGLHQDARRSRCARRARFLTMSSESPLWA